MQVNIVCICGELRKIKSNVHLLVFSQPNKMFQTKTEDKEIYFFINSTYHVVATDDFFMLSKMQLLPNCHYYYYYYWISAGEGSHLRIGQELLSGDL